jgi:hypothetical protein
MSYADLRTETAPHSTVATAVKPKTANTIFQCLVVSESRSRREMLMLAANDAGWDTVVCADPENALVEAERTKFRMALIDFEGHGVGLGSSPGMRRLCQHLSSGNSDLLMCVCGREGDAEEEIWARQLGVWLYLPGVDHGEHISLLCDEGRQIAEKLAEPRRSGVPLGA